MKIDGRYNAPVDPDGWQQERILRGIMAFSPALPLGTLAGSGMAAFLDWGDSNAGMLALYLAFALGAALCLTGRAVARRRTGAVAHDLALVRPWLLLGSLSVGIFWAVFSVVALPAGALVQQGIFPFILAALAALWLPLFALDRTMLLTLAAPVLLPMAFLLLSSSPAGHETTMGSILLFEFAAIVAAAQMMERLLKADGALHRALYHQATHDGLVGVINRAEFERCLGRLESVPSGPYAIVFIDVDRFKSINDLAGHAAGDRVLRKIGEVLREEKRKADIAARVGGDEFAILMELCSAWEAMRVANAVLRRIRTVALTHGDGEIRMTASIGIACSNVARAGVRDVLEAADQACYAAKQSGRDRIELAGGNAPAGELYGAMVPRSV